MSSSNTQQRYKTRSKEEGVTEGVVVGRKCEVTGVVGEMEEREEKVKNPTHLSGSHGGGRYGVPSLRSTCAQSEGRIGRPIQTDGQALEREGREMQGWAGQGQGGQLGWAGGLLAVPQKQKAADGLEELTGCSDRVTGGERRGPRTWGLV